MARQPGDGACGRGASGAAGGQGLMQRAPPRGGPETHTAAPSPGPAGSSRACSGRRKPQDPPAPQTGTRHPEEREPARLPLSVTSPNATSHTRKGPASAEGHILRVGVDVSLGGPT